MKGEPGRAAIPPHLARFRFVPFVANIDADLLGREQRFHHLPECRQDAIECIRKTDPFAPRPRKPGRDMLLPFGGHTIAERRWSLFEL